MTLDGVLRGNLISFSSGAIVGLVAGFLSELRGKENSLANMPELSKIGYATLFTLGMDIVLPAAYFVYHPKNFEYSFERDLGNDVGNILGLYTGFKVGTWIEKGRRRLFHCSDISKPGKHGY